jgi:hypothetical protein
MSQLPLQMRGKYCVMPFNLVPDTNLTDLHFGIFVFSRFPLCEFKLCNILKQDDVASLNLSCQQTLKGGAPSVIAIDVNGNRDIEGVLECLQVVMNERWARQPRLIVVKSRFLYWDLRKMRE